MSKLGAIDEALAIADQLKNVPDADLLNELVSQLTLEQTRDELNYPKSRSRKLPRPALLGRLAQHGFGEEALEFANNHCKYDFYKALQLIADHLPIKLLRECVSMAIAHDRKSETSGAGAEMQMPENVARAIAHRFAVLGEFERAFDIVCHVRDSTEILAAVAPVLPLSEIERALTMLRSAPFSCDYALEELLPRLAEIGNEAAGRALEMACRIQDENSRFITLRRLLEVLRKLPGKEMYQHWSDGTRMLAQRSRPSFLIDLSLLMPLAALAAGPSAIEGAQRALAATVRRWP